jgi:S1-C subfamily serine protease
MSSEPDPNHPPSSLDDTVDPKEMAQIHEMARDVRRESGTAPIPRPLSNPSTPLLPPLGANDRPPSTMPDSSPMLPPIERLPSTAPDLAPPRISFRPPAPSGWQRVWSTLAPILFGLVATLLIMALLPVAIGYLQHTQTEAEIDAFYAKRRAELKAESDTAREQIELLHAGVPALQFGFRQVVRKVAPTVVSLTNLREPGPKDDPRSLVFDPENEHRYRSVGSGSGLLLKSGYLLTNNHVVAKADRLRITFASGKILGVDGPSVSTDPYTDLAVVKLPTNPEFAEEMKSVAEFADSDKDVEVGDWAIAVGSPLGLNKTVTVGVISAKGRLLSLLDTVELLQTDAAINPGNSGGPLFDLYGRVAGINVAIAAEGGMHQGIGFAIPSNVARKIADDLIAHGEVIRGYLGAALEDLPAARAKTLDVGSGAVVTKLAPDDPADRAGIKLGDVIVKFGEHELFGSPARRLRQLIVDTPPGQEVVVHLFHGTEPRDVTVKIGKRPLLSP